jgi:hypothetical protein
MGMKAAVLNANEGRFDVEDVRIDIPGREVLVDVKACGLCHSDLHLAEANYGVPLPAVLGHELAGVVREVGPDVRELKVGDHVVRIARAVLWSLRLLLVRSHVPVRASRGDDARDERRSAAYEDVGRQAGVHRLGNRRLRRAGACP